MIDLRRFGFLTPLRPLILLGAAVARLHAQTAPLPPSSSSASEHYLEQFIDHSVSPRDDFFHYAVGKWLRENPIPKSEASWGVGKVIQEETYKRLRAIGDEAAAAHAAPGSNQQKIGDFWAAAMDTAAVDREGFAALDSEFARIAAVKDLSTLASAIARLQHIGVGAPYGAYIGQDERHSDRYAVHLVQGGLGLPDRDYYFDSDPHTRMLRREYTAHVARMLRLLGEDNSTASSHATKVMTIEKELAGASRQLEDLRDPIKNYNAMGLEALDTLTPSIRWKDHLAEATITGVDSVIVGQPEFFQQLERSLRGHSIDDWKTYLRWHLAHTFAAESGGRIDAEQFHFFGAILNGSEEQRPRWKRALDEEEDYLGDALGQLYVARYFSPATRERYTKLADKIFAAFAARIRNLTWMSEPTKARALEKLNAVTRKVGYPDRWKDYSAYAVDRRSFLGNVLRGNIWRTDYAIAKLHRPVDRTEWDITPQTYSAYYNASNNEIVLPAAVFLLPGIADSLVDDAIVYSYAAGTTIGHEITHGFDDGGRQFDPRGNLRQWWTPVDENKFKQRAKRIVDQFNDYVVVGNLHANGAAAEGENIADLGGIALGWDAFTKTDQYRRGLKIGGLTPAQRYFIGWALGWMSEMRPEALAVRVKTDVHSPSYLRVIGPVSNMVPFYQAYGVRPGDKMYRADSVRVHIW